MVSAEYRTELIVCISAYFTILMIATFWAKRRMEKFVNTNITAGPQSSSFNTNTTAGPRSSSSSSTVQTKLEAHYLGGRTFGPIMTAGTLFASLFSGYTVIGIPDEAFRSGWLALRWMPTEAYLCAALVGTGIRLRKVAEVRRHQTPSDFITDRFQCQILRYVVVALQILPTVIYLAAQVESLKSSFNEMFGLSSDNFYPVVIIMILILLFELVGGLTSVVRACVFCALFVLMHVALCSYSCSIFQIFNIILYNQLCISLQSLLFVSLCCVVLCRVIDRFYLNSALAHSSNVKYLSVVYLL